MPGGFKDFLCSLVRIEQKKSLVYKTIPVDRIFFRFFSTAFKKKVGETILIRPVLRAVKSELSLRRGRAKSMGDCSVCLEPMQRGSILTRRRKTTPKNDRKNISPGVCGCLVVGCRFSGEVHGKQR